MNNFLEKWSGNRVAASQTNDERRAKRDEALKIARQQPESDPPQGASVSSAPAAAGPETFDQLCVCAVHDLPYITRYEKQPNGRFRATKSVKVEQKPGAGRTTVAQSAKIPVSKIDGAHPPCAWCGVSGDHYHCHCGGVVCGGRVKNKIFTCRPSCGAVWPPGPNVEEIETSATLPERKEWKAPPRRTSAWTAPAQPINENRLLLDRPDQNTLAKRPK